MSSQLIITYVGHTSVVRLLHDVPTRPHTDSTCMTYFGVYTTLGIIQSWTDGRRHHILGIKNGYGLTPTSYELTRQQINECIQTVFIRRSMFRRKHKKGGQTRHPSPGVRKNIGGAVGDDIQRGGDTAEHDGVDSAASPSSKKDPSSRVGRQHARSSFLRSLGRKAFSGAGTNHSNPRVVIGNTVLSSRITPGTPRTRSLSDVPGEGNCQERNWVSPGTTPPPSSPLSAPTSTSSRRRSFRFSLGRSKQGSNSPNRTLSFGEGGQNACGGSSWGELEGSRCDDACPRRAGEAVSLTMLQGSVGCGVHTASREQTEINSHERQTCELGRKEQHSVGLRGIQEVSTSDVEFVQRGVCKQIRR